MLREGHQIRNHIIHLSSSKEQSREESAEAGMYTGKRSDQAVQAEGQQGC